MKKILATLILVGLSLTANAQKTLVVNNSGVIQGPVSLATFAAANGLLFANGPLAFGGFASITGTIPPANGGTGVDNTGKTITLGGNLVTSGAYSLTLTATANTNVTFPASGTLLTTTGSAAGLTNFPTFNQNTTGNAGTATLLQTSRNIAGVPFNGGASITLASTNLSDSSSLLRSSDLNSTVQSYNARTRIGGNVSLSGTTLAIGNEYFGTLTAATTYTFSGTPLAGGNPTVLHLTVTGGPWTLTFPASIRDGSGDTTPITSLSIPNGPQDLSWYYSDATPHLHLIDSVADSSGGGLTVVQDDTSPSLGGDLDPNGFAILGYTPTSGFGAVALSNDYTSLSNKPDLSIYGSVDHTTNPLVGDGNGNAVDGGNQIFNYGLDSDYSVNFIPYRDITTHRWTHIDLPIIFPKDNRTATSDPSVTDDASAGYGMFSRWNNIHGDIFMCQDPTIGAAVWKKITGAVSTPTPTPTITPTPTPTPTATPTPTPGAYLINQTFEGTGYANGETWTTGATADPDYSTSPINGSQSLRLYPTAVNSGYVTKTFTANDTVYTQFRFRLVSNSGTVTIARLVDTATNQQSNLFVTSGGVMRVSSTGGSTNDSSTTIPTNTNLYGWYEYTRGTGTNATSKAGWSTTSTKPTLTATGAQTCVSSNGTNTAQSSQISLGAKSTQTMEIIFDDVLLNSTTVP